MFERLITAIIMVVAVAIVASGLPLSSISGAGSGAVDFFIFRRFSKDFL
jgi:hypothetical protein